MKDLLEAEVIRPSMCVFSSPVILVKMKDGTWGMCVDYKALSKAIILDKYPIIIVDELLDELYEETMFLSDPLSPYFFILDFDSLSHMLTNDMPNGLIKGIKLTQYISSLSHIRFTGDAPLFAMAYTKEFYLLNVILNKYSVDLSQMLYYISNQILPH